MSAYKTIKVERENQVTTLVLNRPEKRNAMNPTMHHEMSEALQELAIDPETRVLVLTGAGNSFCSGQDLKEFFYDVADNPTKMRQADEVSNRWQMEYLRFFPAPTIAMVNGFCFGGAWSVVAACDLAIAADEATFGLSEVNWGRYPGGVLPKAIPDLVPFRDVMYYALTGETFDGKKAAEMRFVNFSTPLSELKEAANKLAQKLIEKDPQGLATIKEVFKAARDMNYEQVFELTQAKSNLLRHAGGQRWKKAVEQFKEGKYRPGFGTYEWQLQKQQQRKDQNASE